MALEAGAAEGLDDAVCAASAIRWRWLAGGKEEERREKGGRMTDPPTTTIFSSPVAEHLILSGRLLDLIVSSSPLM